MQPPVIEIGGVLPKINALCPRYAIRTDTKLATTYLDFPFSPSPTGVYYMIRAWLRKLGAAKLLAEFNFNGKFTLCVRETLIIEDPLGLW